MKFTIKLCKEINALQTTSTNSGSFLHTGYILPLKRYFNLKLNIFSLMPSLTFYA